MKQLSKIYEELGIAFTFPIKITDADDNTTYFEDSYGYWHKREYDANGNETYYENCGDSWCKSEYDANGNKTYYEDSNDYWYKNKFDSKGNWTYYENSDGDQRKWDTKSAKTREGKVLEVDEIKYKLKVRLKQTRM